MILLNGYFSKSLFPATISWCWSCSEFLSKSGSSSLSWFNSRSFSSYKYESWCGYVFYSKSKSAF